MPRKKKNVKAAKVRLNLRIRNLNTGQLIANNGDDEYIPSSDYSEDSSDDEYINKRINSLGLIWSSNAHSKRKKAYTGNSRATKFKKYGPSGKFTKAAKLSQPITNFFKNDKSKSQEKYNKFEDIRDDDELMDEENNELENKEDDELGNEEVDELIDEEDNKLENEDDDELENEDDDELEDEDDDELEEDDDELEDEEDDELEDENEEDDNFNSKLIKLEEILSSNLKKITAYDYLRYRAIYMFFKEWKHNNLSKEQASLHSL